MSASCVSAVSDLVAASIWEALANDTSWPPKGKNADGDDIQPLLKTKPENIRVNVLNGTAVAGKAKQVAKELRKAGYNVQEVGNADNANYTATTVEYDPDWDVSAKTLIYASSATVTDKVKQQGSTMNLIVGSDWAGVLPVKISAITQDYTANVNTGDEVLCAA